MTPAERLDMYIAEGRLIRKEWHDGPRGPDGYERACLRVAMWPDADNGGGAQACPADQIPLWLAELLPWMDDAGTVEQWLPLMRRFAGLAHRWHVLDDAGWRRALLGSLAAMVSEARTHVEAGPASAACDSVIDLCRQQAPPTDLRWREVRAAAVAAEEATAAAEAATAAAEAAAEAAESRWGATEAGEAAAEAAGEAAGAAAAEARAQAAGEAAAEARAQAADRIIVAILDAIEAEIGGAQ